MSKTMSKPYELSVYQGGGRWEYLEDLGSEEAALELARHWAMAKDVRLVHRDNAGKAIYGVGGDTFRIQAVQV